VTDTQHDLRLVVVSAGVSDPSSSRLLADRIAAKSLELLREAGAQASGSVVELAPLAVEIARATVSGFPGEQLQAAIERVAAADAIVASTPIYKAGMDVASAASSSHSSMCSTTTCSWPSRCSLLRPLERPGTRS